MTKLLHLPDVKNNMQTRAVDFCSAAPAFLFLFRDLFLFAVLRTKVSAQHQETLYFKTGRLTRKMFVLVRACNAFEIFVFNWCPV